MRKEQLALIAAAAALATAVAVLHAEGYAGDAACAVEALCGQVCEEKATGNEPAGLKRVNLLATRATDADLARLREIPNVGTLVLTLTKVTDAGMRELQDFPSLHTLYLDQTQVTDEGLKDVGQLGELKILSLRSTAVSNAGLAYLQPLPSLTDLNLSYTKVTSSGWAVLPGFTKLQSLNLSGTDLENGSDVANLARIPHLTSLVLGISKLKDEDLKPLQNARLTRLELPTVPVSDEFGMGNQLTPGTVTALKNLEQLSLRDTLVTDRGLNGLLYLKDTLKVLDLSKTRVQLVDFAGMKQHPRTLLKQLFEDTEELVNRHPTGQELAALQKKLSMTAKAIAEVHRHTNDDGLNALSSLTKLRQLSLAETFVTDDWLLDVYITRFVADFWLPWQAREYTQDEHHPDKFLEDLAHSLNEPLQSLNKPLGVKPDFSFEKVDTLDLSATNVSDVGLTYLARLIHNEQYPSRERLAFGGLCLLYLPAEGNVTDKGIGELKRITNAAGQSITIRRRSYPGMDVSQ